MASVEGFVVAVVLDADSDSSAMDEEKEMENRGI